FVLVVAEAKLEVAGALEVRLDAQQLCVPLLCRLWIVCPETDGGESSQHSGLLLLGAHSWCAIVSCASRSITFGTSPSIPKSHVLVPSLCGFSERSEEHTSELQSRGHLVCR